jgi:simple sugar transport system ATP-binding protein
MATVLISTELDELTLLADRIAVMVRGRIVGVVANGEGAELSVGALMTGEAA